jgi:hypothetical protein
MESDLVDLHLADDRVDLRRLKGHELSANPKDHTYVLYAFAPWSGQCLAVLPTVASVLREVVGTRFPVYVVSCDDMTEDRWKKWGLPASQGYGDVYVVRNRVCLHILSALTNSLAESLSRALKELSS